MLTKHNILVCNNWKRTTKITIAFKIIYIKRNSFSYSSHARFFCGKNKDRSSAKKVYFLHVIKPLFWLVLEFWWEIHKTEIQSFINFKSNLLLTILYDDFLIHNFYSIIQIYCSNWIPVNVLYTIKRSAFWNHKLSDHYPSRKTHLIHPILLYFILWNFLFTHSNLQIIQKIREMATHKKFWNAN